MTAGNLPSRYRIITLPFLSYPDSGSAYMFPMIQVTLVHLNRVWTTVALIDSGSMTSFMPRNIAEFLGLDLGREPAYATGVGGDFPQITTRIDRCRLVNRRDVVFEEFADLQVHVPLERNALNFMILGRDSIFRKFNTTFMEVSKKTVLKRILDASLFD